MEDLFSPLPAGKSRWKAFVVSWGGQILALLVVLNINLLYPQALPQTAMVLTHLVGAPPPVSHQPQKVNPKLLPKLKPLPVAVAETHLRVPPLPKPLKREAPVKAPELNAKPVSLPALPRVDRSAPRVIATNVFSTGSSATPTTRLPASKVQTGGFGDPNGIPATGKPGKPANIAALGSFDLPSGPGYGNGTGGSRGVKGVVTSAGFGNGVAIGTGSGGVARHEVHQGNFGDARPVMQPAKEKIPTPNTSPVTPVEILYKPNPVYTEEGRRLKVEGEVKLQVVFTATGKVQVLRVLEGLGHGLDEAAVHAAEQIRFKPAKREGQAIDSSATLRIIFQLA
jgi:TonB family protein